jgi:hypothetical protein
LTDVGDEMRDEDVAAAFLQAKAIDFDAIASLVSRLGPELAVSKLGPKMVLVGHPMIVACMLTAREGNLLINQFRAAELEREVMAE